VDAARLRQMARADSLFALLDEEGAQRLMSLAKLATHARGKVLFQRGDSSDFMAVVLSGRIKVSNFTSAGREYVVTFLGPGDALGEIAALDGAGRTADATTMEETQLLTIRRGDLRRLALDDPDFAWSLIQALCAKTRATTDMLQNANLDMTRRTAAALVRLAQQYGKETADAEWVIQQQMDQTSLAQYAGLSRSNFNRVIKALEGRDLARHEKGVLTVMDLDGLRDLAESDDQD
jgi:CRP/FNR family transcriptional regulator, cyclic AMP receptor protein